jgi:hypothetical protein
MKRRESSLTEKASAAMEDAVRGVVTEHKRRRRPMAIWKDGKVVLVAPGQAIVVREQHRKYDVKTKGKS